MLKNVIRLLFTVVSLWSVSSVMLTEAEALNDYIRDYQSLQFNPSHLHDQHIRFKRAVHPYLQWNFTAYNRTFNLQLQATSSIFTDNHELVFASRTPQTVDTSFIYEGDLEDVPSSSAFISIINGSVSGHVIVPGHTTYHIEPAKNHFKDPAFHTIIYPESKMNLDPYRHLRKTFETCGSQEIYSRLNKMWHPVEYPNSNSHQQKYWESASENKYTAEFNIEDLRLRKKRDLRNNDRTCTMSLQADYLLYSHFLQKYSTKERAQEEILALFASHIKAINDIYGSTTFARTDKPKDVFFRGINFQLQRSKIIDSCTKSGFCNDNLDVSNFLDLTAEDNFDQFCLVHTFTYRDFVGGTLGLAWVATPQSPNAGVCGKYGDVRDSNNGISKRSLNTGIVTLINFKQDVPARVSQLTFAHEVGHNFGSQHDTTEQCAPYGTTEPNAADGNYIMFPSATQGNLPNNRQFSSCSKDSIAKVLETLAPNGRRVYCFSESNRPFCGNKIVEVNETCDCGFKDECSDSCCKPSTGIDNDKEGCQLTQNSRCSPSQGPCCNLTCGFIQNGIMCRNDTDCAAASFCNGTNAVCPTSQPKDDISTFCNGYSRVCINGECIGSVCQNIGWSECFLTSSEVSDAQQMCYVSCKKNVSSECISSFDTVKVEKYPDFKNLLQIIRSQMPNSDNSQGVKRPAGSPCNNYKGFCDVFSKCRNVDAEGPFKQLTDLIFNPVTLKIIRIWIEDRWWAVLLMCIGVVVLMGVFVKVFEYNTPSKDPRKRTQQPPSATSQGASRIQQDKRSGAYSTDLPMYDRGDYGRNQGYDNYAFQGQASNQGYGQGYNNHAVPNRGHQQFDRISKAPR